MAFLFQARPPGRLAAILAATEAAGFSMVSDARTGSLLRTLAASKPGGSFLELGAGTGAATAWLLDGMDADASLVSVDSSDSFLSIARNNLGDDPRCRFILEDAGAFIERQSPASFDVIFADTWAGKFTHLDQALDLLRPGALYIVDDLRPQPNWPSEHPLKVEAYLAALEARDDFRIVTLDWGTGHIVAVRTR